MISVPVDFRIVQEWNSRDIEDLYRSAGWWKEYYSPTEIPLLIRGSFIFAIGINRKNGKAIAMGRILSDRVRTGYIQDLCVLSEMRGHHIGIKILRFLVNAGLEAGLEYLHLIAEPDTLSFYERAGFNKDEEKFFLIKV